VREAAAAYADKHTNRAVGSTSTTGETGATRA